MTQRPVIALCLLCLAQPAFAGARGYLGAYFGPLPATEHAVHTGVIVKRVFVGSAAQQAGLEPGEIVTQINGVPASDPKTAVALLAENDAGERIRLTVIRETESGVHQSRIFATLGASPPDDFAKYMTMKPIPPRCSNSPTAQVRTCRPRTAAKH